VSYSISTICKILTGSNASLDQDYVITELIIDSRKITPAERLNHFSEANDYPRNNLFFALVTDRRNGHDFIAAAYAAGVRAFVVSQDIDSSLFPDAFFIKVADTLDALQMLAAYHRSQFKYPVIGITGSNGKTIVKEWLYQLLNLDFRIVRSPRSYNSQIGVPLSVWRMSHLHDLAIFEAGISKAGEMEKLAAIIRPTIGVFTTLGPAHNDGFSDRSHKLKEKLKLFEGAVCPERVQLESWIFMDDKAELKDVSGETITIPFTDQASIDNALTCWSVMRHLGYSIETIAPRMLSLQPVQMRLEIKRGINQCLLLNDAYSMDLDSLNIALAHLRQQSGDLPRTAILTDLPEGGVPEYDQLIRYLLQHQLHRLITIGPAFQQYLADKRYSNLVVTSYPDRESFENHFSSRSFHQEAILIKGARRFQMDKLLSLLEAQLHQTRMEIDLGALRHNIRAYQSVLKSGVKIMAMVKSFAYGSGGVEIARVMQEEGVAYLGVAYADEGVALRTGGIRIPIMVMNTEPAAFDAIVEHRLEPVLYSMEMVHTFRQYLRSQVELHYPVHIEVETGMNRLGIAESELDELAEGLLIGNEFQINSVFSHFTSGEEVGGDDFSALQVTRLNKAIDRVCTVHGNTFIRHIANSAAAIRHPEWQMDMVRIGIGLYGIDPAVSDKIQLNPVASLLATVAQLKDLKPGDSVSYNRKMIADRPMRIATVRLGYADGFPRRLGNGVGSVILHGKRAPVVGTVCMDMFMVDVSDIPAVQVGDAAIIFGAELPLTELAQLAGTIPYEIMTGISQRVKRIYVEE
jgi:alanine racemase